MKHWNNIVTLEVPAIGEFRDVGSALEAIDCLYSCWRGTRGDAHRQAINVCLAVLDDDKPAQAARDALIAAAKDSHIWIRY